MRIRVVIVSLMVLLSLGACLGPKAAVEPNVSPPSTIVQNPDVSYPSHVIQIPRLDWGNFNPEWEKFAKPSENVTVYTVPDKYKMAPATITRESASADVRVNLVKYIGSVTSPGTRVIVNDAPVTVCADGSYYAYLQLAKGKNTIHVTTINGVHTSNEDIPITFTPPLAVSLDFLDYPERGKPPDYPRGAMSVMGNVTDPRAHVTINDNSINVTDNGSFVTEIAPGSVHVVATLNEETDTDGLGFSEWGIPFPGQGFFKMTHFMALRSPPGVILKPGEATNTCFLMETGKEHGIDPTEWSLTVVEVPDWSSPSSHGPEGVSPTIPIAPGLTVEPIISNLTAYPNTAYFIPFHMSASIDLHPGNYYIDLVVEGPTRSAGPGFLVTVEPK